MASSGGKTVNMNDTDNEAWTGNLMGRFMARLLILEAEILL